MSSRRVINVVGNRLGEAASAGLSSSSRKPITGYRRGGVPSSKCRLSRHYYSYCSSSLSPPSFYAETSFKQGGEQLLNSYFQCSKNYLSIRGTTQQQQQHRGKSSATPDVAEDSPPEDADDDDDSSSPPPPVVSTEEEEKTDTNSATTSSSPASTTHSSEDENVATTGANDVEGKAKEDGSDDTCPPWQNPLHHNNPDYMGGKILSDDFDMGEEMPLIPLPPFESNDGSSVLASPHLHELANDIVQLSMLEVKELVDRVGEHFGIGDDDEDDNFGGGGGGGGGEAGGVAAPAVEVKTVFDLRLTGFDEKSKIKVIKEIRTVTSLGLKEAKELVEGAPTYVKKAIKMEEAEELKTKLEAAGATVEIV